MFSIYGKSFDLLVRTIIYCVGSGISILMSISDGLVPYIFRGEIEKTQSLREEMDGRVFISRLCRRFIFVVNIAKVLFPVCTLTWRINNNVSRQGKGINRHESTNFLDP